MKKMYLVLSLVVLLVGCVSNVPAIQQPEKTPRREYISVNTENKNISDIFVIDANFKKDDLIVSDASKKVATAMFALDLGILETITKDDFNKIISLFFTDLPIENEIKTIVIPRLSQYSIKGDEAKPIEKDAYFFISKEKDNDGKVYYIMETNIPINSYYGKDYDGYSIAINSNYYKNEVPASWVSIMNIAIKEDVIIYQGVAYPNKVSPLYFSGTGIAPDKKLANILNSKKSVSDIMKELESVVNQATEDMPTDDVQKASALFLKKYTAISLSFYAYLDGNIELSKIYYDLNKSIEVRIPEDVRGSQYNRLNALMEYLIKK